MKGIELAITDEGKLQITCLEHQKAHTGTARFCCYQVMIRAMTLGLQSTPEGYHARMLGANKPSGLPDLLFDIAGTVLISKQSAKAVDNGGAK